MKLLIVSEAGRWRKPNGLGVEDCYGIVGGNPARPAFFEREVMLMECKYQPVERVGLYVMVFFVLLNTCSIPSKDDIKKINEKLTEIELKIGK